MQLVFGRDAILNTKFEADWQYIKQRKQHVINQNNRRENEKRRPHEYKVGDSVKVKESPSTKYGGDSYSGPYTVMQVNDNGTCKLQRNTQRGGVVSQTWNIRNMAPYHR